MTSIGEGRSRQKNRQFGPTLPMLCCYFLALHLRCFVKEWQQQGHPPRASFEDKAAEVSAWMLARHSCELVAPPHPSARPVPPPASTDTAQLLRTAGQASTSHQESTWGRTDSCHCASAVRKVPISLPFLTAGKSLLHISQHCPAPPSMSLQGGGIALLQWLAGKLRQAVLPTTCPKRGWGNR